jgi:DNA-binding MarR family transcriptional regulator
MEAKSVGEAGASGADAVSREIFELLDRISSKMTRLTSLHMDKADLSPNRFNALRALMEGDELTMSSLAERLNVSTAAVTSIVDKLEAEELALRQRSEQDRRQVMVKITSRGREAVQALLDVRANLIRRILDKLSPRLRQNWLELYREFNRLLDEGALAPPEKAGDAP